MSEAYQRPSIVEQVRGNRLCIIEASAGTGKTFVIEHLLLDLILNTEAGIDQILAVTFTEKATAELRKRIRDRAEAILRGEENATIGPDMQRVVLGPEQKSRLENALSSFDRAPIFTIHGFCQRILSEFSFLTGTQFAFEVVDGRGAFNRAFRTAIREQLAIQQPTKKLLEDWLHGEDASALEKLLWEAYAQRYLEYKRENENNLAVKRLVRDFDERTLSDYYDRCALAASKRKAVAEALGQLATLISKAKGRKNTPRELEDFNFAPLLLTDITKVSGTPLKSILESMTRIEAGRAARKSLETQIVDQFLPIVAKQLASEKREHGQIDYADMLQWVWDALEGPTGKTLTSGLRERFRYALVDEFQDTDDLQWRIFKRIFAEPGTENHLFVVGDPKQAIYGFRGADVHTYLTACDELQEYGAQRVRLVKCFRSTQNLINAYNLILDSNVSSAIFSGPITYKEPVDCSVPDRTIRLKNGAALQPVTLMRYDTGSNKAYSADAREKVGRWIAGSLRRMLVDGTEQLEILDRDTGGELKSRAVKARDIFLLTRTRAEAVELGGYLREAGVPFAFYKLEGLFQTPEAQFIADVLKAIEDPRDRSRRLRAWGSPFFGVAHRDLAALGDVPSTHPLNERLYEWRGLAEEGQFAELFRRLLHESGLVARELFLADNQRELTNYLHIFEVMLSEATRRRLSLAEIIELLENYIHERAEPPGPNGNLQRLESEREAVQITTVHMSKGLEADVVYLFGGIFKNLRFPEVAIYHLNGSRHFAIGSEARQPVTTLIREGEAREDMRLLYVGLTRARAKLFLPYYPCEFGIKPNGYYVRLNERLKEIAKDIAPPGNAGSLFEIVDVGGSSAPATQPSKPAMPLREWVPPPELIADDEKYPEELFRRIRRRHSPLLVTSYTSLKKRSARLSESNAQEFNTDLHPHVDIPELPGGSNVGIYLHEVIERLNLQWFKDSPDFGSWSKRTDVNELFRKAFQRNSVRDVRWLELGRELVYNALTSPNDLGMGGVIEPLHSLAPIREMEFIYPIPEKNHPLLGGPDAGSWHAEKGFLKGFVDIVFERGGLVYFADWKSDHLASYDASSVTKHVENNYQLQAQIYSVGVLRLLRIRTQQEYVRRFGGLLYIFLRAFTHGRTPADGVYFHRPDWNSICASESELMSSSARPEFAS